MGQAINLLCVGLVFGTAAARADVAVGPARRGGDLPGASSLSPNANPLLRAYQPDLADKSVDYLVVPKNVKFGAKDLKFCERLAKPHRVDVLQKDGNFLRLEVEFYGVRTLRNPTSRNLPIKDGIVYLGAYAQDDSTEARSRYAPTPPILGEVALNYSAQVRGDRISGNGHAEVTVKSKTCELTFDFEGPKVPDPK